MSNPVQVFLQHVANQDLASALALLSEDVVFAPQGPADLPIYGRFEGKPEVLRLFATLAEIFELGRFEVLHWGYGPERVFAHGEMQHVVRKTGRPYHSEWGLVVELRGGLIQSWKIFEDTAGFEAAYR